MVAAPALLDAIEEDILKEGFNPFVSYDKSGVPHR
jgi:hypothetical protein